MSIRDRFEKRYGTPPNGLVWDQEKARYVVYFHGYLTDGHILYQARWEAYQAAMEDAVPEPVEPICAPHDDLNDAFPGAESWARGWNDCRRAMLSSTPAPKDDQ